MSVRPPLGDPRILQKVIVANPKFSDVESVVDTGSSVLNQARAHGQEVSIKPRPGELFRRIRPSSVANFIDTTRALQERMSNAQTMMHQQKVPGGAAAYYETPEDARQYDLTSSHTATSPASTRPRQPSEQFTVSSAAYGSGKRFTIERSADPCDARRPPPPPGPVRGAQPDPLEDYKIETAPRREILLLDVRPREDYEACHIQGALSYPSATLSRAQNQFTREILYFRNRDNHIIVIYDLDEEVTVGNRIGNVLFERGVDNIFVLSGGLTEFVPRYPTLIVGVSPVAVPDPPKERPGRRSSLGNGATTGPTVRLGSGRSGAGALVNDGGESPAHGQSDRFSTASANPSVASSHRPKALSSSLAKPVRPGDGVAWR